MYISRSSIKEEIKYVSHEVCQIIIVEINDWYHLLSWQCNTNENAVWMLELTKELDWKAQGRDAGGNKQTWVIRANHHTIQTLTPTYDHNGESMLQVHHTLEVCMTTEERSKECLACTANQSK